MSFIRRLHNKRKNDKVLIYITTENHKLVPWLNETVPFSSVDSNWSLSQRYPQPYLLLASLGILFEMVFGPSPLHYFLVSVGRVWLFMSHLFYEQNPHMIISGVTTYLILLQNKGNILFTYKYVIVFFVNVSISECTLTRWFVMCLRIPQNSFD